MSKSEDYILVKEKEYKHAQLYLYSLLSFVLGCFVTMIVVYIADV